MAQPPATDAEVLEIGREMLGYVMGNASDKSEPQRFTAPLYNSGLRLTAATASPMSLTFALEVPVVFSNPSGGLHGGAAASIIDDLSSHAISVWALVRQRDAPEDALGPSWVMSGTSRTINVSYLRPVPAGTTISVYNEVQSIGRSMAFVRTRITDAKTNKVLVTGEHHKVAVKPQL